MSRDPWTILGLTAGLSSTREIDRQFIARRRDLRAALHDPARYTAARRDLEELYQAYRALREPNRAPDSFRIAEPTDDEIERVAYLRRLIELSLEGGLLRYSRRREILGEGQRLGYSEFHTQLLIAQVQFGGELVAPPIARDNGAGSIDTAQVGLRVAAAGVLALALFLAMVRWLGA